MSDCDGLFSTTIQYMYCKLIEPNCDIEIIVHSQENPKAHGLNDSEVMEYLLSQEPSYLFINDASTNDVNEMKQLVDLGWIVCCSDHHQLSDKIESNPYCILVNNQISPNVINKGLSGGGVVWKCCKRYDKMFGCNYAPSLISFVAMSIISDNMDLRYEENYSFVKWGRERLHKNLIPFVEQLNRNSEYDNNKAYSFGLITCCNSLIRLGTTQDKLDLTYAMCGEYEDIGDIINRCSKYHTKQTNETKRLMDNSIEDVYDGNVYLGKILEKTPLTGLVANKLLSKMQKPIILVHDRDNGECGGSVRSNVDTKDILNESGLFIFNEGHLRSHGTSYYKSNEQDIINYLDTSLTHLEPCTDVLIDSTIKCLPSNLFSFNEQYKGYFGVGIPIPQVHIKSFSINSQDIQLIGKNKTTIKFTKDGLSFLKFFCGEDIKNQLHLNDKKNYKMSMEVIGELGINEFRGQRSFQCIINELEVKDRDNLTVDDIF